MGDGADMDTLAGELTKLVGPLRAQAGAHLQRAASAAFAKEGHAAFLLPSATVTAYLKPGMP